MAKDEGVTYEKIHPDTALGPVHYNVIDLERMTSFYRDIIGMQVLRKDPGFAVLGTEERELLQLTKVAHPVDNGEKATGAQGIASLLGGVMPSGEPKPTTGLYHTAFLVPTKRDLAYLTRKLIDTRTPVQGTSDHGTHLALYLPDPEGNGIELAWDYPREQWPDIHGQPDLTSAPRGGVDIEDLLETIAGDEEPWPGVGSGTTVGHVHLRVADLDESSRFYNETLGFDVILHSPSMGASFLSAGGYHHHFGMNIWQGRGLPPAEPDTPGLRHVTIVVPDEAELERVIGRLPSQYVDDRSGNTMWITDPSGIKVLFTVLDQASE